MKRVTVNDLAKISGYSQSTVSRSLNNSSLISDITKMEIQKLAEKMKYRPNIAARSLIGQKVGIVGLCIGMIEHLTYSTILDVLKGIADVLLREGFKLLMIPCKEKIKDSVIPFEYVDGVIIFNQEYRDEDIEFFKRSNIPFVVINGIHKNENYYRIRFDYEQIAYDLTKLLFDYGHKEIALLSGPVLMGNNDALRSGYLTAIEELGIPKLVFSASYSEENGYELAKKSFEKTENITAFLGEDFLIVGAMQAIKEKDLKIPEEIAVLGINNIPLVGFLDPPLSSFHLPMVTLGQEAAKMIVILIKNKEPETRELILSGELVIRKSC